MGDKNRHVEPEVSEVVVDARPITPHDDNDVPDGLCLAVLVNVDCTLNIVAGNGQERTAVFFHKGWNPIAIKRVKTGEDAATTNIWGGYTY